MRSQRPIAQHHPRGRERGVIMILVLLSLVIMLGLVGLALDGGHGMLNKTRLQNVVDASALSAAKTLDQNAGNQALARAEALALFAINANGAGHGELAAALESGALDVIVEFSNDPTDFSSSLPASDPAEYVRVRVTDFRLPGWFIPVFGVAEKVVGASAVAGPSPRLAQVCNVVAMVACGDPGDPSQPNDPFFGYQDREYTILKFSTDSGDVGPGNFHLARLDGGSGADAVRKAMAGDFDACVNTSNDTIETEPGNTVGPVSQGLNTRFGIYAGPMGGMQSQYPPDVIVTEVEPFLAYDANNDEILYGGAPISDTNTPDYDYDDYLNELSNAAYTHHPNTGDPPGAFGRRTLAMPVGDCSGPNSGQGQVPLLGVLCFHLLQRAEQKGNESHVYGQFIGEGCGKHGNPGPAPDAGPGPFVIQVYKDPNSRDS